MCDGVAMAMAKFIVTSFAEAVFMAMAIVVCIYMVLA